MRKISDYTILHTKTVLDALKKINSTGLQIIFTVNDKNEVLGALTDGDIRRAIIKGIGLDTHAGLIANKEFIYADEKENIKDIIRLMEIHGIRHIPVLAKNKKISGVHLYTDFELKKNDIPILIFAGGRGKRLNPITKQTPKPLLNLGTGTVIENIIDSFLSSGFVNLYVSLNYKSEMIKKRLMKKYPNIFGVNSFIIEKSAMGTAGALSKMKNLEFDTLITHNGDIISDIDLNTAVTHHNKRRNDLTSVLIPHEIKIEYGIAQIEGENLKGIYEKPIVDYYAFSGINIISKKLISKTNINSKLDMDKFILTAIDKRYKTGYFLHEGLWIDIGNFENYAIVKKLYGGGQ